MTALARGRSAVAGAAAVAVAVLHGARIIRTHNVAYARQFLAVFQAIRVPGVSA